MSRATRDQSDTGSKLRIFNRNSSQSGWYPVGATTSCSCFKGSVTDNLPSTLVPANPKLHICAPMSEGIIGWRALSLKVKSVLGQLRSLLREQANYIRICALRAICILRTLPG